MNPAYLSSALDGATIPTDLIIQLPHAWAVVVSLLILCCTMLWLLTRGVANASPEGRTYDALHPDRKSRPARSQATLHPLHPLAHHGSRAA